MMASPLLVAKISSMLLLGGISLILGILPIKLASHFEFSSKKRSKRIENFITFMNCFGSGVILTTCITHMLPEVNKFLHLNVKQGWIETYGLPMGEIFFLAGFIMLYVVEEVVNSVVSKFCLHDNPVMDNKDELPTQQFDSVEETTLPQMEKNTEEAQGSLSVASLKASLRGLLVILALALHAIFEGIAVGLNQNASIVWYLCFAIAAHKYIISFCLGMQFVSSGYLKDWIIVLYQATFSLVTPIGIGIGIALTETSVQGEEDLQTPLITVLQGLAAGTLLYVVFFEILEKERRHQTSNGLIQVSSFAFGVAVMILAQLFESHDDSNNQVEGSKICLIQERDLISFPVNISCTNGVLEII